MLEYQALERDTFLASALAEGVPIGVNFPRLLQDHSVVASGGVLRSEALFEARCFAERHVALPIHPSLSIANILEICRALRKILDRKAARMSPAAIAGGRRQLLREPIADLCSGLCVFLDVTRQRGKADNIKELATESASYRVAITLAGR